MSYKLPAGKYYIGDPCYVIRDADWDKVCGCLDDGIYDCLEFPFFMASTAYGDGGYMGSDGNEYGVDSGCLGAVPLALIKKPLDANMVVKEFPEGLEIEYDGTVFKFGNVEINTDPEEETACCDCGLDSQGNSCDACGQDCCSNCQDDNLCSNCKSASDEDEDKAEENTDN